MHLENANTCNEPACMKKTKKSLSRYMLKCTTHYKRDICVTRGCHLIQRVKWVNIGIDGLCIKHYKKVMKYITRRNLIISHD